MFYLPGPPCKQPAASVIDDQVGDDAGGNRRQHIVAARLHPVITPWQGPQMVVAPVVHDILVAAVAARQVAAAADVVVGSGTIPTAVAAVTLVAVAAAAAGMVAVAAVVIAAVVSIVEASCS